MKKVIFRAPGYENTVHRGVRDLRQRLHDLEAFGVAF